MTIRAQNWIDGQWVSSIDKGISASTDPATGMVLGEFADSDEKDADEALLAAATALKASDWAHNPRRREAVLRRWADRIEERAAEVANFLSRENGKLLSEAQMEVGSTIDELRYYAGLTRNIFGRLIELEPGKFASLHREPIGVASIIVPWNAPLILGVRSLAPAMAAGCTAVVKTAPQTALVSEMIFRLLSEDEEIPAGAINLFCETGSEGAKRLVSSPLTNIVSYTGSSETGKAIMSAASANMTRVNLELGGSAPCILFDDADLDQAVPQLVRGGLFMAGQFCCSATRLIVHASILDETVAKFSDKIENVIVGPGLAAASQMGPVVDRPGLGRVCDLVSRSVSAGAQSLVAATAMDGMPEGSSFLRPGLLLAEDRQNPLYKEEVFGPLLVIDHFEDEDEALAKANDSDFGLASSVWSNDLRTAQRAAHKLQAGTVWINSHGRLFAEVENGGYKHSGIGALHGHEGLSAFLQTKHINWSTQA